ncbi:MAG: hypothetical protein KDB18_12860 [Salinibacterium sp.]|nr:hypothetical protein [Salinibacterium sp.]
MRDHPATNPNAAPRAVCVVWCPPEVSPPRGLMEALRSKGLTTKQVSDGYTALSGVLAQRSAAGIAVLVIVEPDRHRRYEEVNAALDRYAPRTARWTFVSTDQPPLQVARSSARKPMERSVVDSRASVEAKPDQTPPPLRPKAYQPGPMLRLTGLGVMDLAGESGAIDDENARDPAGLTSEEMAALLADDLHEGSSR